MRGPERFPVDQLVADSAMLAGAIQWDSAHDLEPALTHAITVHCRPLRLSGTSRPVVARLRLDSIRLPVSSWRQLAGRSFELPNVVKRIYEDGEEFPVYDVYGSLTLGAAYHELQTRRLEFGPVAACAVAVGISGLLRFGRSEPAFADTELSLRATAALGPVTVVGDVAGDEYPDYGEAVELARRFLALGDYEEPFAGEDGVTLAPRGCD